MDSMDHVRERFDPLEQQTEPLKHQTQALQAPTRPGDRRRWWPLAWLGAAVAALGLALVLPFSVQAKTFRCGAGDVPCLIDAINAANANGEANTIRLAAGTYTLTAADNFRNGLPVITSPLTITGRGADTTSIERDASAASFRILEVAAAGTLTLKRLTLRGGIGVGGGGIANRGTLTLVHTTVRDNLSAGDGGGIVNRGTLTLWYSTVRDNRSFALPGGGGISILSGTVLIAHSTIESNGAVFGGGGLRITGGEVTITASAITDNGADAGGGIANSINPCFPEEPCRAEGTVIITGSAITHNTSSVQPGGGIFNLGTMEIINTTIAQNQHVNTGCEFVVRLPRLGGGNGIHNDGTLLLLNSTVADNAGEGSCSIGLHAQGGSTILQNTIVARNTGIGVRDCVGPVTTLGHNLIGDPTGCTITLLSSDLTGDPGFGPFTDNGRPGNGHFPLLPTSQAIDAGNDAVCPRADQLGRRRLGPCDIGAIAFRERDDRHQEDDDQEDKEHDDTDPVAAVHVAQ